MPDTSITMVRPDTPQMTSAQMSAVPSLASTSHAVVPSVMPRAWSSTLIAPLLGCASSTVMKLSTLSPITYGRKKMVRSRVEPLRLARTTTAIRYPTTRMGSVTMAVYSKV